MQCKNKTNLNHLQYMKAMAGVHGKSVLPDVKMPRKRRTPSTKPRKPYNLAEAKFRKESMKYLRRKGCKVRRVENRICGKKNVVLDSWVTCRYTGWGGWVEFKSLTGVLSDEQKEFIQDCIYTNVRYLVADKIEDYDVILKREP